jgi:hypothetical protein
MLDHFADRNLEGCGVVEWGKCQFSSVTIDGEDHTRDLVLAGADMNAILHVTC